MNNDRPIGPTDGQVTNFTVTGASVHFDLTVAGNTELMKAIAAGRMLTIEADLDVGYRWSPNTSGGTVDLTMVFGGATPANQCAKINAGERKDEMAPLATKGLIVIAGGANTVLRIYPS